MEENVALDSSKQKKFVKSITGIKKLIQKKDKAVEVKKPVDNKVKDRKVKKKRRDRGLVYLSHIPHGFYEHQMTEYFKQFGGVTNARVIRSKRTGRSKGHAFVEFREPEVAEIVAETMNNYLMGKRLIKAALIPAEKQRRHAMRKNWNTVNNPGANSRLKLKKAFNTDKDEKGDLKRARKLMSNIQRTQKKLSELGITYDFTPVDIPQALIKIKKENVDTDVANEDEVKLGKKKDKITDKASKNIVTDVLEAKPKKETAKVKNVDKKEIKDKKNKSDVLEESVANKKVQKVKNQKLKDSGVQPMENFIKVQQEDNDSDSSYEFDSDEYDKMLENDENNSNISEDGSDASGDEVSDDDIETSPSGNSEEESVIDILPKKAIPKCEVKQLEKQKHSNQQKAKKKTTREIKRKAPISTSLPQKKAKFEKQNKQKPVKKQFKKKK